MFRNSRLQLKFRYLLKSIVFDKSAISLKFQYKRRFLHSSVYTGSAKPIVNDCYSAVVDLNLEKHSKYFQSKIMSQNEECSSTSATPVPSLRKYHTFEASGDGKPSIHKIRTVREIYAKKSLLEKAEEANWRISDVVSINDLATWPEYAEDLDFHVHSNKKPKGPIKENLNEKIILFQGDITKLNIDAIVNAANNTLLGGGGVDGAIHRTAGPKLLHECRTLNGCDTGDAKITAGYLLPAKYVIHTVGPIAHMRFVEVGDKREEQLRSCYETCLERIKEHNLINRPPRNKSQPKAATQAEGESEEAKVDTDKGGDEGVSGEVQEREESAMEDKLKRLEPQIRSVAFPCISTGIYGYPPEAAAHVALKTVREWLEEHPQQLDFVIFCVFLNKDLEIYEKLLPTYFPIPDPLPSKSSDEET